MMGDSNGSDEGIEMTDKTEWELVDEPGSGARRPHRPAYEDAQPFGTAHARAQAEQPGPEFGGRAGLARAILGPRWKFKVAGMAALASVVVILAVMLTGIVFLVVTGLALLSFGMSALRRLLHGGRRKPPAYPFPDLQRRNDRSPY